MVLSDLQKGLSDFTEELSSQTYLNTYRVQRRDSLLAEGLGTRANSIWKMAQYIIATYDGKETEPMESYLKGWGTLVKNYKNQFLIIETSEHKWQMYDSYSNFLGEDEYIANYIKTHQILSSDTTHSYQLICYGAPGTGKSHEVKKLTGELLKNGEEQDLPNVFRTTFHPDTDYASFVGCYKPAMEFKEPIYTQAQLIDKLSIIKNSGVSYPCQKFGAKYWESLKELSANDIKQILTACGFTDSMSVEVPKGIAIGEEFASMNRNKQIVYRFVPQVFTDAYVYAYTNQEPTYLVIEEINRGNCAQIFGDLFQLLDRKNGKSEYKIKADKDLAQYLRDKLGADSEGIKDEKLCLPANLHILATMNTSDQSLFPMDSAFKRRWEWEYVPINYADHIKSGTFDITIGEKKYSWVGFIKQVNEKIFDLTQSEDKQMGNFFIKHSIKEEGFKNKVMFYLWYEVLCDETENNKYFFYKKTTVEGKDVLNKFTFKDLYGDNATEILQQFMEYLKVFPK
jgi:5-methylcytosine-specific restriction endonuclease McrBC GTP-binding regulatory subunit McrB